MSEASRLAALRSFEFADTERQRAFDRLAKLAADLLGAPIGLVTLIGAEQAWCKSAYGVEAAASPRSDTICDQTIRFEPGHVLIVEDTLLDERFASSPWACNEPHIRFYAGTPLTTRDGHNIGTLCILDIKPRRRPDRACLDQLVSLADIVVDELELARANRLADEKQRLLELAEAMVSVGSWRYQLSDGLIVWSDEVYRIYGVSRDAFHLTLESVIAPFHPEDRATVKEHLAEAVAGKSGYEYQLRLIRPDGDIRDVRAKALCELDHCGEVTAVVGVFQDVTESVRTMRAVQTSESKYRLLADNLVDAVIRLRFDGTIDYISPGIAAIIGYKPVEIMGRFSRELAHKDDRGLFAAAFAELARGASHKTVRHRLIHKDGHVVWVESKLQLVASTDEGPSEVVGVIRDISERRALELALEQSEARYRDLADKSSDIIVRVGRDGLIRYVSPASRKLGYEPEEMLGQSILKVVAPDSIAHSQATIDGLWAGTVDGSVLREHKVLARDGREVWMEGNPTLVRNEQGEVTEYISAFRDITRRKALETQLLTAQREAEEAAAVKSEFLANMSHELRTPLTAMLGFARLVHEQPELTATTKDYSGRVLNAGKALLTTVNDILDFSKLEAGQVEIRPLRVSPTQILRETVSLFEHGAAEKGVRLALSCSKAIPPFAEFDPDRVRQILLNLAGNAVKFTERGSVDVRADYDADTGSLVVSVEDTGPGIAPEQTGRLFQRFSQVDASSTRKHGGTGLGLAICKGLIDAMHGDIGVESKEGAGSRFWFTLPAPIAHAPRTEAVPPGSTGFVQGTRILLAEDSAVNRKLVHILLEPMGFIVTDAEDGAEAVRHASQQPFDLILMDLRMPKLDGKSAASQIRSGVPLNAATPMLAFSAEGFPDLGAGLFDGVIEKPVTLPTLRDGIATALGMMDKPGVAA